MTLLDELFNLASVIEHHRFNDPGCSYVALLFTKGINEIIKKIGEEAIELIIASKDCENNSRIVSEMADLWFHCLILLSYHKISLNDIMYELEQRKDISGIEEKKKRNMF